MIPIETIRAAFPVVTSLVWTQACTDYYYDVAMEAVEDDFRAAREKTKIVASCYYIASLATGQKGEPTLLSESLGDHSYSRKDFGQVDTWMERYEALKREQSPDINSNAFAGVSNPEVPRALRLDRWTEHGKVLRN